MVNTNVLNDMIARAVRQGNPVKLELLLERQRKWNLRLKTDKSGLSTVPNLAAQHIHAEVEADLVSLGTLKVNDKVGERRCPTTVPIQIAEHIRLCSVCNGAGLQERVAHHANGSDYLVTPTMPSILKTESQYNRSGYV